MKADYDGHLLRDANVIKLCIYMGGLAPSICRVYSLSTPLTIYYENVQIQFHHPD
jgi:hypothetical protein